MTDQTEPEPPVLVDNKEAYAKRATIRYGRLNTIEDFEEKSKDYSEGQKRLIELESRMFGINPSTNPRAFVEAHASFVIDAEADLQDSLPRVKDEVVDRVSGYFAKDDKVTREGLKDLMRKRLAATKEVGVFDSLAYERDMGGFFNSRTRQPQLVISELALAVDASTGHDDFKQRIEKVILAHEVMHGILTSGTQATGMDDFWSVRNGISVDFHTNPNEFIEDKTIKHGQWLNEALLESFRRQIFETDDVRYEPGVILLETLDALSPGLRDKLVLSALDAKGPGPTFGKVEQLLGPTGIEEVEALLLKVNRFADLLEYKISVIAMLPKDLQAKAAEIFNRKELEVFGKREWYRQEMAKLATPLLDAAIEKPLE